MTAHTPGPWPELLQAAKHALRDLYTIEDGEPNEGVSGVIVELKNAIAKAEGGHSDG